MRLRSAGLPLLFILGLLAAPRRSAAPAPPPTGCGPDRLAQGVLESFTEIAGRPWRCIGKRSFCLSRVTGIRLAYLYPWSCMPVRRASQPFTEDRRGPQ